MTAAVEATAAVQDMPGQVVPGVWVRFNNGVEERVTPRHAFTVVSHGWGMVVAREDSEATYAAYVAQVEGRVAQPEPFHQDRPAKQADTPENPAPARAKRKGKR